MRRTRSCLIRPRFSVFAAALIPLAACGEQVPDGAGEAPALAGMDVAAIVDPALFDSIAWPSEQAAFQRGATVYAYSCVGCHGTTGQGDGGYRIQGRPLRVPTFLEDDWAYAHDLEGLRARIHAGDPRRGMPHWSEKGLTPRDTDAVARYITWGLWRLRGQ